MNEWIKAGMALFRAHPGLFYAVIDVANGVKPFASLKEFQVKLDAATVEALNRFTDARQAKSDTEAA